MPEPPFHLGYRPALDGIRGVAVLAVMLYHFGVPFDQGGFLGVDAFFVLSGFLITSLLVEECTRGGRVDFGRFYVRRALRLLPALLVMLAAVALVTAFGPSDVRDGTWRGIIVTLAYVANWEKVFSSHSVGVLGHTWSLSVEEQFYMLWPVVLTFLLRRRMSLGRVTVIAAAMALASAATRAGLLLSGASSTYAIYNGLETRADSLLIGCAAALAVASGIVPRRAWPLSLRVLVGTALPLGIAASFEKVNLNAPALYYAGFLLFACAVALVILGLVAGQATNVVLAWKPLVWIGARSYGLYLWHLPVHEVLKMMGMASSWPLAPYTALNVAISLALATLSYRYVEMPALRWKDRIGRPSNHPAPVPGPRLAPQPAYATVPVE